MTLLLPLTGEQPGGRARTAWARGVGGFLRAPAYACSRPPIVAGACAARVLAPCQRVTRTRTRACVSCRPHPVSTRRLHNMTQRAFQVDVFYPAIPGEPHGSMLWGLILAKLTGLTALPIESVEGRKTSSTPPLNKTQAHYAGAVSAPACDDGAVGRATR